MAEECTWIQILASYLRVGSLIITLLTGDASWMTPFMLDNSIPLQMESMSKRVREPSTLATAQGNQVPGEKTKKTEM